MILGVFKKNGRVNYLNKNNDKPKKKNQNMKLYFTQF